MEGNTSGKGFSPFLSHQSLLPAQLPSDKYIRCPHPGHLNPGPVAASANYPFQVEAELPPHCQPAA